MNKNIICGKIKRRIGDFFSKLFYNPIFLTISSKFYFKKKRGNQSNLKNKLGEFSDMLRSDFIAVFNDILDWQKNEKDRIKINVDSCEKNIYSEIDDAYKKRSSHKGKPGHSRILHAEMIWETIWPILNLDLKPGMRVADIGTENSFLPPYFASKGCEAYGLDAFVGGYGTYFREKILNKCDNSILTLDVKGSDNKIHKAIYKETDATRIDFPDNFFDRITCLSTIEHIFKDSDAAKEMARILKPGGILALTTCFNIDYSQNNYKPGDEMVYKDADTIYNQAELFSKIIEPSGLKIGEHDFSLGIGSWKKHHFIGQSDRFVSVAIFLKKI